MIDGAPDFLIWKSSHDGRNRRLDLGPTPGGRTRASHAAVGSFRLGPWAKRHWCGSAQDASIDLKILKITGLQIMMEWCLPFVRALFAVIWAEMISRTTGPLALRFLLQPLMASALAVRDGIRDANLYRTPYLATIMTNPAARRARTLEGLRAVSRVLVLSIAVDLIYQYTVLGAFRPIQALIIGVMLAFVPYLLVRGPAARITRWVQRVRSSRGKRTA
ncbi:MAG TPA: hypothetical protein VJP60_04960 [Rhizomicrobium sp.]|nr:hypothetical protein [Rhizomicrobium sp.]